MATAQDNVNKWVQEEKMKKFKRSMEIKND